MKSPAVDQEVPQEQDSREPTEVLQTVAAGGADDETLSVVDEAVSDALDSDFGAGIDPEGKEQVGDGAAGFGETMNQLALSSTEATVLRKSFDMVLAALGNDREALGDAIYGLKIHALVAIKENFTTPRAVVSLRFFNCFRLLLEKAEDPNELKIYVETLAFKHLNNEITEQRVDAVLDAFHELMVQNVPNLPPGTAAAWRKLLSYTGSCYRYVGDTYGERLRVIKEDWAAVQKSATDDRNKDETKTNAGDNANAGGGENANADEAKEDDTADAGAETFSFGRMCAFSNEVMGQKTEGWMLELLQVFHILVDMISSPVHLQEECDLLAINLITKSNSIDFEKFKPVMLAALRSLLPKQWSTLHETSWEWLWTTVARNLNESTMKVRAFKPYNIRMFSSLQEEQLDRFRKDIFTEFFARSQASQDLFKQSQTRLRYIADRVLQSSSDMFQKNKDETLDDLSALGLRHVGYGIPIELFGPFVEVCVQVMHPLIQEFPNDVESTKLIWCPKDRAHQIPENEMPEHMMIEGFRWSIGLTARVLVRTIMDGSTAVMQAIHFDDSKRLRRALADAPRVERFVWQLAVQVGSQSISPLFWALRSGAHDTAKTMIEDVLTIRADRDNYYYGADELFKYQPNIADNVLREAPFLAETLLDGLIWRSHKSKDNLRPVIYYLKHLLQDMDETKMLSRALISYIRFDHPQTIMHPILAFSLDLLWDKLALRYFIMDRVLTIFNCFMFIVAECLTARVLVRTIMDGSTAVMQAIHFDDSKRLRRALVDAPRVERSVWQLAVQVGSQSISPLFWALRSGAHDAAKTMIQDILTIRADRDNYYYGADEMFKYQPNIADNILREAPFLAESLLDGLIWRSHKSQDNLRPVIYYLKHLLQDMDESKMLSRALISYIRFNHPQTIMHPILAFSLDLLWEKLALRYFLMDRILTIVNCIIFVIAECYMNQPAFLDDPSSRSMVVVGRILVYTLGFLRLLYWHICQIFLAYRFGAVVKIQRLNFPAYLMRGSDILSFLLMMDLLAMNTVEPIMHCIAAQEGHILRCPAWTDEMSLLYEIFVIIAVFLYVILIVEVGSVSIKLSEYRVLCLHAIEQVLLCFGVVLLTILTFAFAISGMTREMMHLTSLTEWADVGTIISTLIRLSFGAMDIGSIQHVAEDSPLLIVVIILFMMMVYTFFFNLLVSQFCGVYTSLAADIKGHARLARGEIIIETFKAVKLTRWQKFMNALHLDQKVDFEQGDIGLAGGIKTFEPALAHPVAKDQIIRFGGRTESHLPWPEKIEGTVDTIERTIQKTIQKTLHKYLGSGKKGGNGGMSTFSTNTGASETDASSHQGGEKASVHSSDHDHHSE